MSVESVMCGRLGQCVKTKLIIMQSSQALQPRIVYYISSISSFIFTHLMSNISAQNIFNQYFDHVSSRSRCIQWQLVYANLVDRYSLDGVCVCVCDMAPKQVSNESLFVGRLIVFYEVIIDNKLINAWCV